MVRVDPKYTNLVHVWEFRHHHYKYSQCVEKEHRILIVCRVRGYQVQDNRNNSQKLPVPCELLAVVYLFPPGQPIVDSLVITKRSTLLPVKEMICNDEMSEVNDGPGHARRTAEDGEDDEPGEEEDEDVSRPYTWIREPLRVSIHIGRRHRSHVHHSPPSISLRFYFFFLLDSSSPATK